MKFCSRAGPYVLATLLVFAPSADAQRTLDTLPGTPPLQRIDTATFSPSRLPIQPARQFRPFDTTNVSTAQLNQTVTVAGKTMTRRDFIRRANQVEAQMNANGYSLRDPGTVLTTNTVEINTARLDAQRAALIGSKIAPLTRPTILQRQRRLQVNPLLGRASVYQLRALDPRFATARRVFPSVRLTDTSASATPVLPIVKTYSRSWDVGDRDVIQAGFGYSASLTGDTAKTALDVGAEIDAYFFDRHANVAEVEASADAPKTGAGSANAQITVLGTRVYNKSLPVGSITLENNISKSVDYSVQTTVYPYGIPITVRVGGRGTVGLDYGLSASAAAVTADVTPSASLNGYAEASIDLWLVEGGAGGSLMLLQLSIPVDGKLVLVQELDAGIWGIHRQLSVGYDVRALDGRLYGFAKVSYPCGFLLLSICHKRYEDTIFSWTGVHDSGLWVNQNDYIDLMTGMVTGPKVIAGAYTPRPAVGSQSTLTFTATDANSGAALNGTVTVAGQTVLIGQQVTATFCAPTGVTQASGWPQWIPFPAPTITTVCRAATFKSPGYLDRTIMLRP